MTPLFRRVGYAVLVIMIGVFLFLEMTGSYGISSLIQKQRQISDMQKANADLARENQLRRDRIEKLETDRAAEQIEVRKRMKYQRKDTIDFYLPPDEVAQPPAEDNSFSTVP